MKKKPITTLFMLESLDGKISSGNSDNLDADNYFWHKCIVIASDGLILELSSS